MDIIFVASLKSYTTAVSLIKAFKNNGHNLTVLSDCKSNYIEVDAVVDRMFDISDFIIKNNLKPELVFFCEGGSMKLFPLGLENIECKSAWYGIDTHMDLQKHLHISRFFDLTFIAQKEYVIYFQIKGFENVYWLPLAFDISMSPNEPMERIYDIAFVGSVNRIVHPERQNLILTLKNKYPNSFFGTLEGEEMYKLYSQAKIVFNKSVNNDVNMRFFESIGNGAVLLTNKIDKNGVEEIFEPNFHYLEYDESNILDVVDEYLKKQKDNSFNLIEYVKKSHTYDHRVRFIVEQVNNCSKIKLDISGIDYAKLNLQIENFSGFLENITLILKNTLIANNIFKSIFFSPLLLSLKLTSSILKTLGR